MEQFLFEHLSPYGSSQYYLREHLGVCTELLQYTHPTGLHGCFSPYLVFNFDETMGKW